MLATLLVLLTLASASATTKPASPPCDAVDRIDSLLRPGLVLLLGEIHGTVESPAFALDVACHASRAGLPVIVGLELPPTLQPRVDAYVHSSGSPEDRRALLASPWWQSDYQDGRASRAMLDLIDGVRVMRQNRRQVRVALFDAQPAGGAQKREQEMARNLAVVAGSAEDSVLIVLTGNRHSRVTRGSHRDAEFEPMGYLLGSSTSFDRLVALDVAHGDGSAWICAPECGVVDLRGHHGQRRWAIDLAQATRPAGHRGWYHVGSITASPPATRPDIVVSPPTSSPDPPAVQPTATTVATGPLSDAEGKFQGVWQAHEFVSLTKTWSIDFEGRRFRAEGGEDDWYEGHIAIRPDLSPAQLDFVIDDCRCSFKGGTSEGIYFWDGESLVVAAPQPGSPRPREFLDSSGQMMRLLRMKEDR